MHATTYASVHDFLATAGAFLRADEAINGLPLGIAQQVATTDRYPVAHFATVALDGAIIAAAVMTPPHNIIPTGDPAALPALIEVVAAEAWPVPGVFGARPLVDAFAEQWAAQQARSYTLDMAQRLFKLTAVIPPQRPAPGTMRPACEADVPTLAQWFDAFRIEAIPHDPAPDDWEAAVRARLGNFAVWVADGTLVAMIGQARPSEHGISVGPVYTPPEQRGHGYATHLTAAFSQHLLDSGYQFCVLFTDLANPTSNSIYQQIGYRPVCDFATLRFGD